jgi:hypothetical protein
MKWIKFSDMMPPIGMYIFVISRNDIGIIQWQKKYIEFDSEFVGVQCDNWDQPREIYALDFWAPVSFFSEYIPDVNEADELPDEMNWYLEHKDHENIAKIKAITDDSGKQASDYQVKTDYGSCSYYYRNTTEASKLFKQINGTWQEPIPIEKWMNAAHPFNPEMFKVPSSNLIAEIVKTKKVMPENNKVLRFTRYNIKEVKEK